MSTAILINFKHMCVKNRFFIQINYLMQWNDLEYHFNLLVSFEVFSKQIVPQFQCGTDIYVNTVYWHCTCLFLPK